VPDVPMVELTTPGRTTPKPTAPHIWSPPPPTTGIPGVRPSARAAFSARRPITSGDSDARGGTIERGMPSASNSGHSQARLSGLKSMVPVASVTSMSRTPVILYFR